MGWKGGEEGRGGKGQGERRERGSRNGGGEGEREGEEEGERRERGSREGGGEELCMHPILENRNGIVNKLLLHQHHILHTHVATHITGAFPKKNTLCEQNYTRPWLLPPPPSPPPPCTAIQDCYRKP